LLNPGVVGVPSDPVERSWGPDQILLYALAVGAGQDDPLAELEFTTENTDGVPLRALPTYASLVAPRAGIEIGDYDRSQLVHSEQAFVLHRPLTVAGATLSSGQVTGIYDKGHAAVVTSESRAVDLATGEPWITTRSSVFIRGEGGFGGDRGVTPEWREPEGAPEDQVRFRTRIDQALLYRLTGDRNPLHSDPGVAARGGFARPILHGMCTFGYTGRALLRSVCDSDPARFGGMEARFTHPVLPGDELVVSMWRDGDGVAFRTSVEGVTVLDRGRMTLA
jgi:acyl dehydratase